MGSTIVSGWRKNRLMTKKLQALALATLFIGTALSLLAADAPQQAAAPATQSPETTTAASLQERIDALLALPGPQRRAELKALGADERRQLWIQLKRTQAERKNLPHRGAASGSSVYRNGGTPIDGQAPQAFARAAGTIQYDANNPSTSFGGGAIIGNRFNTHTGGVQVTASGTVDTVVAVVVPGPANTTNSAGFVLLGPQTGGGGAFAIFSTFTGATGTVDTITFPGIGAGYTGSSFFVLFGDFANSYIPAFSTGTANGQGHHGVVGYTGGMGPNITSTFDFGGTRNGLVRVTGNVLPVELLSFDVE